MSQFHLRIPADDAKAQLVQRAKLGHDLYLEDSTTSSHRRYGWHELNVAILESMFSSDRMATQYKEFARTLDIKPSSFPDRAMRALEDHIKALAVSVTSFPYLPDNAITESSPTSLVKAPASTMKWEFGTIEVMTPSRDTKYGPGSISSPGVVKGDFSMEKTLEVLARDGWDIFAVLPSYQETGHDHILVTHYLLFFKRPARAGG